MIALSYCFLLFIGLKQIVADGTFDRKSIDLVQASRHRMIFNYNVTLYTNEIYCVPVTGVKKIQSMTPKVTVNTISTHPLHKLSDLQFYFLPDKQFIGGVPEYSRMGGTDLGDFPLTWNSPSSNCRDISFTEPDLQVFDQLCIVNTCGKGLNCYDWNTFIGELTIEGLTTTTMPLAINPTPSTCGSGAGEGIIEFVAQDNDFLGFNFQALLGPGESVCSWPIHTTKALKRTDSPSVVVNMSFAVHNAIDQFVLYAKYPDGSTSKAFGSSSGTSIFGTVLESWPGDWTGTSDSQDTCYTASVSASALTEGWNQICVANGCSVAGCDSSQSVYTGHVRFHGYTTTTEPDWVGRIQQSCTDVIAAPTHSPTSIPYVTKGDRAAIILVTIFGLIALVFSLWFLVVGFRRMKRMKGQLPPKESDANAQPKGCLFLDDPNAEIRKKEHSGVKASARV